MLKHHQREVSIAAVTVALALVLAAFAPGYFARDNLSDLFLGNMPVLIVALGTTLVILTGHIDISVGSVFAICGVVAGVVAKAGAPVAVAGLAACLAGAMLGALNGALVAYVRIPSIVVTLATMVALRDGLRWVTQGAWVQDLPAGFQWFGLAQSAYPLVAVAIVAVLQVAHRLGDAERRGGPGRVRDRVERAGGAAGRSRHRARDLHRLRDRRRADRPRRALNSVRFNQIPSNAGIGLEMKVIAAAVVGGAAIRGGRGSFAGTLLGVVLLGAIGPALTFLGVSAYWERALQGAIILAAVALDALRERRGFHAVTAAAGPA